MATNFWSTLDFSEISKAANTPVKYSFGKNTQFVKVLITLIIIAMVVIPVGFYYSHSPLFFTVTQSGVVFNRTKFTQYMLIIEGSLLLVLLGLCCIL